MSILSVLAKALMPDLDLDSRYSDGRTAAEKVALRDEAPEGFANPFERLVQSILDERFEACGWANTPASAVQSWHNFEGMNWYEAEAVVAEDVDSAEKEAEMATNQTLKEAATLASQPDYKAEKISVADMM